MKKSFPVFISIFIIIIAIFSTIALFSNENSTPLVKDDGYEILNYDVNINVAKDRTLTITEKIVADFYSPSRGIVRNLPLAQSVVYNDNGKMVEKNYKNKYDESKIKLSTGSSPGVKFVDAEEAYGYLRLYMGQDSQIQQSQTYVLTYEMKLADDRLASKDIFYFNVIGTGWDTDINNINYSITFPTSFDAQDYFIYQGAYGEDSTGTKHTLNGNTITGNVDKLAYGQALTIKTDFQENYFIKTESKDVLYVLLVVGGLLLAGIIVVYVTGRRKRNPVVVVEVTPPADLSPTEAGLIIDGYIDNKDISSLIVYWAEQGCIKIKEEDDDIKLTKISDLPEKAKSFEITLFENMFNSEETLFLKKDASRISSGAFSSAIQAHSLKEQYFKPKLFSGILIFALIAMMVVFNFFMANAIGMPNTALFKVVLAISCILPFTFITNMSNRRYEMKKNKLILYSILTSVLALSQIAAFIFLFTENYCDPFGLRYILSVFYILILVLVPMLELRTKKGVDELGRLLGLKRYIEVAEKERIEMLAKDDPQMFYKILPYAYVLGVSDIWIKQFDGITIEPPIWYESSGGLFEFLYFNALINRTFLIFGSAANLSNVVRGNISSGKSGGFGGGGFGGGGGFSGGGFGGGGGGRF